MRPGSARRNRRCLRRQGLRDRSGRSLESVEVDPDGKIAIRCNAVEIGKFVCTAVANRVSAILGAIADEVAVAQIDSFGALDLVTSFDPYTISQERRR